MRNVSYICILLFLLEGCVHQVNDLEFALMQAGENRLELEKVLRHYANDSLKYKAACFLIKNMPYHYYFEGPEVEYDKQYYHLLSEKKIPAEQIADSLIKRKKRLFLDEAKLKLDIQELDSAYLIDNIEHAFKVWREQPWGKNVSFDVFCKYILPYRIGDEVPVRWREDVYKKFNPLLDNVRERSNLEYPWIAAQILLDTLKRYPIRFSSFPYGKHSVGPEIVNWMSGNCLELTDALTYIYRALGIPSGCDMMPVRGDNNVAHYWNFVQDNYCKAFYCSLLYQGGLNPAHTYYTPKGKVYRKTFNLNKEMQKPLSGQPEKIHPYFRFPLMEDVTEIYTQSEQAITISDSCFYTKVPKGEIIYLCMASWQNWIPVAYSQYTGKQVIFDNVDGNVVFRLAIYRNGKLKILSDALWVHKELEYCSFFNSEGKTEKVTLLHKFNLFSEPFVDRMVDGVFEASNDMNFADKDTLFIITEHPIRLENTAYIESKKKYRYFRYFGPPNGYCNVAEVAFYENKNDSEPLHGKILGTSGTDPLCKSHWYINAFDRNPYTSFDFHMPSGGWAGIDALTPKSVSKIIFTPRNRDNFICKGNEYELFYDKKGVWISVGKKKAISDSLVYEVPKGALLYLKNHTKGKDERIFEYYNGEQLFW